MVMTHGCHQNFYFIVNQGSENQQKFIAMQIKTIFNQHYEKFLEA